MDALIYSLLTINLLFTLILLLKVNELTNVLIVSFEDIDHAIKNMSQKV
jgi:hypothetical protein